MVVVMVEAGQHVRRRGAVREMREQVRRPGVDVPRPRVGDAEQRHRAVADQQRGDRRHRERATPGRSHAGRPQGTEHQPGAHACRQPGQRPEPLEAVGA
jgi:hypothetical protein